MIFARREPADREAPLGVRRGGATDLRDGDAGVGEWRAGGVDDHAKQGGRCRVRGGGRRGDRARAGNGEEERGEQRAGERAREKTGLNG